MHSIEQRKQETDEQCRSTELFFLNQNPFERTATALVNQTGNKDLKTFKALDRVSSGVLILESFNRRVKSIIPSNL